MKTEISITIPDKIYRSDSIDIDCQLNLNLSNYKIRAELFDQYHSNIYYATVNAGGSDTQIKVTNSTKGQFTIYIAKNTTTLFHLVSYLEIEIEDTNGKVQTVYFTAFKFNDNIYMRN